MNEKKCEVKNCPSNKNGKCREQSGYKLFDHSCPEYEKKYSSGDLSEEEMEQA